MKENNFVSPCLNRTLSVFSPSAVFPGVDADAVSEIGSEWAVAHSAVVTKPVATF